MEGTMSKEITLPSGNTVKLRDPETLLKKDRDKVLQVASEHETPGMQAVALIDGLVAVSVVEWSFDLIPPAIRLASLGELTPRDYQVLSDEAMKAQDYLFPDMGADKQDDPKVNTANSND
jgi:hypothetical protein